MIPFPSLQGADLPPEKLEAIVAEGRFLHEQTVAWFEIETQHHHRAQALKEQSTTLDEERRAIEDGLLKVKEEIREKQRLLERRVEPVSTSSAESQPATTVGDDQLEAAQRIPDLTPYKKEVALKARRAETLKQLLANQQARSIRLKAELKSLAAQEAQPLDPKPYDDSPELESLIAELTDRVEAARERVAILDDELKRRDDERDQLEREKGRLIEKQKDLQLKVTKEMSLMQDKQREIQAKRSGIGEHKTRCLQLESQWLVHQETCKATMREISLLKKQANKPLTTYQIRTYAPLVDEHRRELAEIQNTLRARQVTLESLSKELVLKMKELLQTRTGHPEEVSRSSLDPLRERLKEFRSAKDNLIATHRDLLKERSQMSGTYLKASRDLQTVERDLQVKRIETDSLRKRQTALQQLCSRFAKQYAALKSEKTMLESTMNSNRQTISSLRERLALFDRELEVIKRQILETTAQVRQFKNEYRALEADLSQLTRIRNSLRKKFVERETSMAEQLSLIRNYTDTLNTLERQLISSRRRYVHVLDERNFLGLQLVDRNDELAILYEKYNFSELLYRRGLEKLRLLQDEISNLKRQEGQARWAVDVKRKAVGESDNIIELEELQSEIIRLKKQNMELERRLVEERDSRVVGSDVDEELLRQRLEKLKVLHLTTKEAILEKNLILEEFEIFSEIPRRPAPKSRPKQQFLNIIAEIAMFVAVNRRLEDDIERLTEMFEDLQQNPPEPRTPPSPVVYEDEDETLTTAHIRPTFYEPKDAEVPLPVPYGKHAPFLPKPAGAHMRHYRKPEDQPIVI